VNLKFIDAGVLHVAYEEYGPTRGPSMFLMHGFPYDVCSYHAIAPQLAKSGFRVIVPYLRGYGPTRFIDAATPRSGEQAALGNDLLQLMDALEVDSAYLAGYDWGGRAACVVAALWPERVRGLVSCNGYNIQNIAQAAQPAAPADEHRYWYQYYLHSGRGRLGLAQNRYEFCKLLWQLWSPNWDFSEATYAASASSFENPDFVDVVVHSYRHRYALVASDAAVLGVEERLSAQPTISVPTIAIDGAGDGVMSPAGCERHAPKFIADYERRVIALVGHNIPQEAPAEFTQALRDIAS
jgi:pimeloyl-ACP methyl ester carboxylesterase